MPCILSIETSADACSISLWDDDWLVSREADEPRSHARMLVPLIQELLRDSGKELEGICVDEGPGSYTGLRIGVSTAKGLAWSLNLPLFAVPSLALVAAGAVEAGHAAEGLPVHVATGARGTELFSASYVLKNGLLQEIEAPTVLERADLLDRAADGIIVPGSASVRDELALALPQQTAASPTSKISMTPEILPHSRYARALLRNPAATYRVEDVSSFEPRYMRAFVARKPSKSIFDRLPF